MVTNVAQELAQRRGGNGLVRVIVDRLDGGMEVTLIAGRDFVLDEDLGQTLARLVGEENIELSVQSPPRLALVG